MISKHDHDNDDRSPTLGDQPNETTQIDNNGNQNMHDDQSWNYNCYESDDSHPFIINKDVLCPEF